MIRLIALVGLLAIAAFAQDWTPTHAALITRFTPLARMARATGDVVIRCALKDDGTVESAEAVSGHALLRDQARENALGWRFQRTSFGKDQSITLTYQYRLEGAPSYDSTASFTVIAPNVVRIVAAPPKAIAD